MSPKVTPTASGASASSASESAAPAGAIAAASGAPAPAAAAPAISVTFYDSADFSLLQPPDETNLEIRVPCGIPATVSLHRDMHSNSYGVTASHVNQLPNEVLGSKTIIELRLKGVYELNCRTYAGEWIAVPSTILKQTTGKTCCTIPIPLSRLEESCTIKFRAYDCSFTDFVKNANAFLNDIRLTVIAVRAACPQQPLRNQFKPFTASVTTVQGCAEIPGVPLDQLYQMEAQAPAGYIAECSVPPYLHICCERSVALESRFRPCGEHPSRSVIFVNKDCPGIRMKNFCFQAGGRPQNTDPHGTWNLPADITGTVSFQALGYEFLPAQIAFTGSENLVTLVQVASATAGQQARMIKTLLTDENEIAFAGREVFLQLPNGEEIVVTTDERGCFHAPVGSKAHVRDDQFGSEVPMMVISE